jgi:Uma2 family endonuclease
MEEIAKEKHEFLHGEIFLLRGPNDEYKITPTSMAGASEKHNIISTNIFGNLCNCLKGSTCRPYGSDKKVFTKNKEFYSYPDISIHCNKNIEDENNETTVIIEILSPTTRSYDLGEKFRLYRTITELKEYVVIDSEKIYIEVHKKINQQKWEMQIIDSLEGSLIIETIDFNMPVDEIYHEVFSNNLKV